MNFLNIARHLLGKPQEPTAPVATSTRIETAEMTMYETFAAARSPLIDIAAESHPDGERVGRIYRDTTVHNSARACHAARVHAIQQAGALQEIHAAIEQAEEQATAYAIENNVLGIDGDLDIELVTAHDVASLLLQRAEALDEAAVGFGADAAAHRAAVRACDALHAPLKRAISKRLSALVIERDGAVTAIEARARASAMGLNANTRHAELRRAGLSDAQIRAVDPTAANPEVQDIADRLCVIELSTLINRLRHADVTRESDLTSIVGIDAELDAAIAFHRAESTAA